MKVTQEDPDPPGMKTCSRCGILKPLEEYSTYRRVSRRGKIRSPARASRCKECMKEINRENYRGKKGHEKGTGMGNHPVG
jgi:hypothetical protein